MRPCVFLASLTATRPRACVVARTWRVDDDGAFLVRLEPAAPPPGAHVKGIRTQLCAVLAVAPHADDQLKSEGDEEYEPERALVSARIALVDGGGRLAPGRGWVPSSLRAAAQRFVADAVALSVSDLADAWEHDIASINEPEDEDASFEREALRARATPPSVSQRKVSIGGERARLEKIVVEKQGAERRAAVCFLHFSQLQRRIDNASRRRRASSRHRRAAPKRHRLRNAPTASRRRRPSGPSTTRRTTTSRSPSPNHTSGGPSRPSRRASGRATPRRGGAPTRGARRAPRRRAPTTGARGGSCPSPRRPAASAATTTVATVLGVVGVSAVAYSLVGWLIGLFFLSNVHFFLLCLGRAA